MMRHRHKWLLTCDCRNYDATVERNCCCVNDTEDQSVCWVRPIKVCGCGKQVAA